MSWAARLDVLLITAAVLTGMATGVVVSGILRASAVWLVADATGLVGAVAAATAFASTGARQTGVERWWRWLMAAALAGWGTGQALWTWHRGVSGRAMTFPDLENAFYLILPVCVFAALISIARADHALTRSYDAAAPPRVLVCDGLIIVTSLLALTWETTLGALVARRGASIGELLLSVSYTLADLVLIVIAMLFAVSLHSMWRAPLAWIMAGHARHHLEVVEARYLG